MPSTRPPALASPRPCRAREWSVAALVSGDVQVQPLISHRFAGRQAKAVFDLLYAHMDQALGVLLKWG